MWKDWRPLQIECRCTGYVPEARPLNETGKLAGAGKTGVGVGAAAVGVGDGIGLGSGIGARTGAGEEPASGAEEAAAPAPQAVSSSTVIGASRSLMILARSYASRLLGKGR